MARYAALLRGVNVGRGKRVPMAGWRERLEGLGCTDVKTLLNSGNAVFTAPSQPAARLAARIEKDLLLQFGVASLTIVKTAAEIAAVVTGNPLAATTDDPSRLLVALTADDDALRVLRALSERDWGDERLHVGPHAAYLWCADGILQSRIAVALLRELDDRGTTRNWATVQKIAALMG